MKKPATKHKAFKMRLPQEKTTLLRIGAILLFLLLAGSLYTALSYRLKYIDAVGTQHTYPLAIWEQGAIVSSDNIAFRLNSVRTDTQDVPHYWELPAGSQFMILNVTVANKMATAYSLSPILTMYAQDTQHNRYPVSSAPSITLPFGGEVAPGQSVTGEVGIIIPKDTKDLQFFFNPRTPGDNLIVTTIKL